MAFDSDMQADPTLDPLQGMDIKVVTYSALKGTTPPAPGDSNTSVSTGRQGGVLVGAFTSAMFKIVNQTETYLPLNQRIPRHLDGEIIIVYALEQGLVDPNVMTNTFGQSFAAALGNGRGFKVPRSSRFNVRFSAELSQDAKDNDPAIFFNDKIQDNQGNVEVSFVLLNCRVDTFSFGMTSGRHIVANSWQGTAEGLKVELPTGSATGG